ncbi:MAG: rod-binding protein [Lachnospiraceae bacterium]|nr:rod-binding protein [Lachnospiraceae bacterium]
MDIGNLNSIYSDLYSSASDAAASKLESKLKDGDYSKASDKELMDACKQFESYFLEQMFKEMMKTIPESDSSSSNGKLVDYFKDEMMQNIASESTETNSLGLAQMLYEQMKRNIGTPADSIS